MEKLKGIGFLLFASLFIVIFGIYVYKFTIALNELNHQYDIRIEQVKQAKKDLDK